MAGVALGGVSPAAAVSDTLPATHYMVALPQPLSTAGRQPSAMPWFSASDGAAGASGASVSGAVTEVGGDSAGGGYSAEVANGTLACAALDVAVLREQLLRLCGSRPPAVESSGKEGPHGARHDGGGTSEGEGYFEGGGIGGSGRRYGPGSGEVETGDEVGAKCGSAAQRASLSALHALSLQEVISLELEVASALLRIQARRVELAAEDHRARARSGECVVCWDRHRAVAFAPCGHVACCELCADEMPRCPMCKSTVEQRLRVFLG